MNNINEVLKKQLKFLATGIITIILSIIGMIIFHYTGLYIIHPVIYLVTLLMGIGWTATAIVSILNNKKIK